MPIPESRDAPDVVGRLEAALVALERSFAALEINASLQRGEVGRGVPPPRPDQPAAEHLAAPLTTEERRRLAKNLEALLEEVRQLADYLASDASAPDPPKPD